MKLTQIKRSTKLATALALSGSLVALGLAGTVASAHTTNTAAKTTAVKVHLRKLSIGKVLVNGKNHTIYMFAKDTHAKSHCSKSCQTYWPPVISKKKPIAGTGLSKKHLGRIKKTDQVTYYGHPLYTFVVDTKAGKDEGEGISDFGARWYVLSAKGKAIKPKASTGGGGNPTPTPTTTSTPTQPPPYIPAAPTTAAEITSGTVASSTLLKNAADNHTLYYLTTDLHSNGTFTCTSTCQKTWIPLMTLGDPTASSAGLMTNEGTISRSDDNGEVQVTYLVGGIAYPVYEYVTDTTSSTANGNHIPDAGGYWYDIPAS